MSAMASSVCLCLESARKILSLEQRVYRFFIDNKLYQREKVEHEIENDQDLTTELRGISGDGPLRSMMVDVGRYILFVEIIILHMSARGFT